jgi:hypothetical protein
LCHRQEKTIREFSFGPNLVNKMGVFLDKKICIMNELLDISLVDNSHSISADGASIVKSIGHTSTGGFFRDELNGLNNTTDNLL